jgi:hypothetical protein
LASDARAGVSWPEPIKSRREDLMESLSDRQFLARSFSRSPALTIIVMAQLATFFRTEDYEKEKPNGRGGAA